MIASTNVHALKEWAITVRFLGTGRQILLLRKGGVLEQQDGFEVKLCTLRLSKSFRL
jgi:hypothetical protein